MGTNAIKILENFMASILKLSNYPRALKCGKDLWILLGAEWIKGPVGLGIYFRVGKIY
jgi:hypothetical protein